MNSEYEVLKSFTDWLMDDKIVSVGREWNPEHSNTRSSGEILVAVDADNGNTISHLSDAKNSVWENALEVFLKTRQKDSLSPIEKKSSESQFPLGFDIKDLDSLEETAELIFKNKVGTAELFVGGKDYLVMQHDLNKPVSEQVYDVYSVQETLGMKVPFDDMVQKIKDDIIQSIQMGR